jgi:hypothetical protein
MQAIKDILKSERGLLAVLILIAGAVLTGMGKMTVPQWQDYSLWTLGIYTGGKSLEGAAGAFKSGRKPDEPKAKKTSEDKPTA